MCRKSTCRECVGLSVTSTSLRLHEVQPSRLLYPWHSPVQNTGVGCHSLPQRIFLTQGSSPGLPHCRQIPYHLSHRGRLVCRARCFVIGILTEESMWAALPVSRHWCRRHGLPEEQVFLSIVPNEGPRPLRALLVSVRSGLRGTRTLRGWGWSECCGLSAAATASDGCSLQSLKFNQDSGWKFRLTVLQSLSTCNEVQAPTSLQTSPVISFV